MLKTLLLTAMLLGLSGCYTVRMALHHNDLFNSRRPVADVRADPAVPAATRNTLALVDDVLAFAKAEGLATAGAYRFYIDNGGRAVSYIVQAAYSDRLAFKTWWFPIVGDVPYLGFFSEAERDQKAAELRQAGYDVATGSAGAFSSLGWFDDPIFSSMLQRGEAEIGHLFLHELTHRTVWIAGAPEFNENLAEYVASVLTVTWLEHRGRGDLVVRYRNKLADKTLFQKWLTDLKKALQEVYAAPAATPRATVLAAKAATFARYLKPPLRPRFQVVDYIGKEAWNNAEVLAAALYTPDLAAFAAAHRCLGHGAAVPMRDFLAAVDKAVSARPDEPFKALARLCLDHAPSPAQTPGDLPHVDR